MGRGGGKVHQGGRHVGGRQRWAAWPCWASAPGPPVRVPAGPSCPCAWALGSPLCAGTQLQGPAPRWPPSWCRLPGGEDVSRPPVTWAVPPLVSWACGESSSRSQRRQRKSGSAHGPARRGRGLGGQPDRPCPQQQTGWRRARYPLHQPACLTIWHPAWPGPLATSGHSPILGARSSASCNLLGARHLPALRTRGLHPALRLVTGPCTLPLGQEAPG